MKVEAALVAIYTIPEFNSLPGLSHPIFFGGNSVLGVFSPAAMCVGWSVVQCVKRSTNTNKNTTACMILLYIINWTPPNYDNVSLELREAVSTLTCKWEKHNF